MESNKFEFKLNLRTFDGEEPEDEDLDVGSDEWIAKFEAEFEASNTEEEIVAEPEPNEPEIVEEKAPVQTPEANRAFQELRRQADEGKKFTAFIAELAEKQGMTPDEFIEAAKEANIEREAKELKIDPAVHKENVRVANENVTLKETINQRDNDLAAIDFNTKIELARVKMNLTPEQVTETFTEAFKQQLDPKVIPFEKLHALVNLDATLAKAKADATQEYLAAQKKKQDNFVPHSQGVSSTDAGDTVADVRAYLKEMGDM